MGRSRVLALELSRSYAVVKQRVRFGKSGVIPIFDVCERSYNPTHFLASN